MSRGPRTRVALVTGAGSGIGAASAKALAFAGATVAVTDINVDRAGEVAAAICATGGHARAWPLDVSSELAWHEVVGSVVERYGPVTVLHSNAALTASEVTAADRGVTELDIELFDRVLAVNLRGAVLACKHVIPGMLAAGGGSIILTSSVKGSTGSAYRTAYSVSKGGLDTLTKVVATGYGKRGIRCNAVAPGIVSTEAIILLSADQRAALREAHLTPDIGRPEDIANAVVFLASDESAFITGQIIAVDGGLAAHIPALSPASSPSENT
jgi:NAD(P)-dependent dehydrogenase (short-subunit alcohol dehydrogenase family)